MAHTHVCVCVRAAVPRTCVLTEHSCPCPRASIFVCHCAIGTSSALRWHTEAASWHIAVFWHCWHTTISRRHSIVDSVLRLAPYHDANYFHAHVRDFVRALRFPIWHITRSILAHCSKTLSRVDGTWHHSEDRSPVQRDKQWQNLLAHIPVFMHQLRRICGSRPNIVSFFSQTFPTKNHIKWVLVSQLSYARMFGVLFAGLVQSLQTLLIYVIHVCMYIHINVCIFHKYSPTAYTD